MIKSSILTVQRSIFFYPLLQSLYMMNHHHTVYPNGIPDTYGFSCKEPYLFFLTSMHQIILFNVLQGVKGYSESKFNRQFLIS